MYQYIIRNVDKAGYKLRCSTLGPVGVEHPEAHEGLLHVLNDVIATVNAAMIIT